MKQLTAGQCLKADESSPGQAPDAALDDATRLRDRMMDVPLFPEPQKMQQMAGKRPIAVIGAGFSGTIATLQLLRRLPPDQPVLLCERSHEFARGVAYATADNNHLLNVRASNMSAFTDAPLHFQDWLNSRISDGLRAACLHETAAGVFASRGIYGRYLRSLLDDAMRQSAGHARLRLLPDDIEDVVPDGTDGYRLVCAGGQSLPVEGVVLAVGNLSSEEDDSPHICRNPWVEKAWRPLDPERPVLIVGTGLTMVDIAVGLRRRGFLGGIVAMSRGGRLPAVHAGGVGTWPTPELDAEEARSVRRIIARLRREIAQAAEAGVDWRAVIDSMRPATASLWSGLPLAERKRFLRHARRFWDVHRHRMAPPHDQMIRSMLAEGSLRVLGGRVESIDEMPPCGKGTEGGVRVTYRPAGARTVSPSPVLDVQRVIMAAGAQNLARTTDWLIARLRDRGLVSLDLQGMGLDVTDRLRIVRSDGQPEARIWALGPIVRGVFWECVAVPDIRVQAAKLAESVAATLQEAAPRWGFSI